MFVEKRDHVETVIVQHQKLRAGAGGRGAYSVCMCVGWRDQANTDRGSGGSRLEQL